MKSGEYKIEESQKGLTIILLFPEHIRTYKELFFLTLSFSLFFFVFVGLDLIMQGLLWLIFLFFMFMGPSILGYLYYKNQKREWFFSKSGEKVIFLREFRHFKRRKEYNFADIKYFVYKRDYTYLLFDYNLSMVLDSNEVKKIYIGELEDCEELGSRISEFMGIQIKNPFVLF